MNKIDIKIDEFSLKSTDDFETILILKYKKVMVAKFSHDMETGILIEFGDANKFSNRKEDVDMFVKLIKLSMQLLVDYIIGEDFQIRIIVQRSVEKSIYVEEFFNLLGLGPIDEIPVEDDDNENN